jgi:protein-S-isoprenylcysteine O-methyltransferase Ste14
MPVPQEDTARSGRLAPAIDKLRRDGVPMVLFALIVGAKVYSLWRYLESHPALWYLLRRLGDIDADGPGALYYLANQLSYVLYFAIAIAFDALVFYSFVVRSAAKSGPRGVWENVFPLITVFVPVIGFTLLGLPAVRQSLPGYSPATLDWLRSITPAYGFYLTMTGLALGCTGAAFSIWVLSHLKRSFGLRVAVRSLVTDGPYARVRHPLYLGEIVHIGGIAVLSATPVGLWLFAAAVVLQLVRAKIEERKFLQALPEYAAYQARTGFLWPRWGPAHRTEPGQP